MNHKFQNSDTEHATLNLKLKLKVFKPFNREQAKNYRRNLALKIREALEETETFN